MVKKCDRRVKLGERLSTIFLYNILRVAKNAGVSVRDIPKECGVSKNVFREWICGDVPDELRLVKISNVFRVNVVDDLLSSNVHSSAAMLLEDDGNFREIGNAFGVETENIVRERCESVHAEISGIGIFYVKFCRGCRESGRSPFDLRWIDDYNTPAIRNAFTERAKVLNTTKIRNWSNGLLPSEDDYQVAASFIGVDITYLRYAASAVPLLYLRSMLKLTQSEFAEWVNIPEKTIASIENGDGRPLEDVIKAIEVKIKDKNCHENKSDLNDYKDILVLLGMMRRKAGLDDDPESYKKDFENFEYEEISKS